MKVFPELFLILITTILISFCKENEHPAENPISYMGAYAISVPEPSGLDLTYEENGFWTVSDETSTVYKLDNEGNVVNTIKVDGFDFEGITVIDETTIAIVLERAREIVILDTSGTELKRIKLNLEGELNSGIEGITYNPKNGHYFVVNEKKPSLLLELDDKFEILHIDTLKFSKDVSGIYYDEANNILWILSDENQLIVKTDLNGNLIQKTNITIVQPEGITINKEGKRLYIVSDNKETLYMFEIN